MNLQARISAALESELSKIYDELGIESGDISPIQEMQWEALTAEMTLLFAKLIAQNK